MTGILTALATVAAIGMERAGAAEPPTEPILRIETGMHTAAIKRIDIDRAEKLLLTTSNDKTARLWSLPDGRLVRVLRPPIGEGNEGKLYAGSLSPDGKLAAVTGWTGWEWDESASVYLFDTATGALVHRLTGAVNAAHVLTFSADGSRLAAGLGAASGIRVWDTATWREVLTDHDYDADVYGLSFAADGRLAVASYDGYIRVYDRRLSPTPKKVKAGGERPLGIAFSPDGGRLAVGYQDVKRVEVRDADDLELLFRPNVAGGNDRNMASVTWSADGRSLFAAGLWDKGTLNVVRRWADGGRGDVTDLNVTADDAIMDLVPFGRAGVAFGSADPAWQVLDGAAVAVAGGRPVLVDQRDKLRDHFTVDDDGGRIRFGLKYGGSEPVLFDMSARSLEESSTPPAELRPARTSGLDITDWEDDHHPLLDGESLTLERYEMSRSLAIAPSGDRFVIGADWRLRMFDRRGERIWEKAVPGTVWGVNISGDGKLVVAAYADGTFRWHRMSDGRELLALFVDAKDKRWVAWTPKGYYMASPGGESMIGWHVNNGKDSAADFYGAGRFRATFDRPDVVERVLTTLDEAEALALADAATNRRPQQDDIRRRLPPVVEIVSPAPGSGFSRGEIEVRYRVRSPSGVPVTRVKVLIDGQSPTEAARGLGRVDEGGSEYAVTVAVPSRDITIGLVAETENGAGEVASLPLKWTGAQATDPTKPKLYALLVGTAAYTSPKVTPLRWAAQDARDLEAVLARQKGGLYRDVETRLVTDGANDDIRDGLEWLERQVTSRDVAIVFLSGHGVNDSYGDYWYLPRDADPDSLRRTALRSTEFKEVMSRLAGKGLMMVDTCHAAQSGVATGGGKGADISGFINELAAADSGVIMFTSATGRQLSVESDSWRNGAFTEALLEALGELKADADGNGAITLAELDLYLSERVKALTGGRQSPVMIKADAIPNIPIALGRH